MTDTWKNSLLSDGSVDKIVPKNSGDKITVTGELAILKEGKDGLVVSNETYSLWLDLGTIQSLIIQITNVQAETTIRDAANLNQAHVKIIAELTGLFTEIFERSDGYNVINSFQLVNEKTMWEKPRINFVVTHVKS